MEAATSYTSRSRQAAVAVTAKPASRLLYIDNLRVYLTILVILHHLMIIYAGSGGWIYQEGRQDVITDALGGWFCAVNQAYFMGLFLLISAYFVPGAYDRKGPGRFVVDRLVRLGLPLAAYSWVIRPVCIYFWKRSEINQPFWDWYTGDYFRVFGLMGGGPLWFIEALLLFSLLYALARALVKPRQIPTQSEAHFPRNGVLILFALSLAVASFLVRIISPVNATFLPLNFQFANFPQYIAFFIAGLVVYRQGWLSALPDRVGKRWLGVAIFLILLYPPLGLMAMAVGGEELFLGGWYWQALALSIWEAFLCLSACIGLISFFRRRLDRQGPLAQELSRSAYTAYLIHEPVITVLAVLTAGILLYPLLKFVVSSLVLIPACFALSSLIRRLPYVRQVV
jgi:surface polysaccharide O-acyltransferase-like enzyme